MKTEVEVGSSTTAVVWGLAGILVSRETFGNPGETSCSLGQPSAAAAGPRGTKEKRVNIPALDRGAVGDL